MKIPPTRHAIIPVTSHWPNLTPMTTHIYRRHWEMQSLFCVTMCSALIRNPITKLKGESRNWLQTATWAAADLLTTFQLRMLSRRWLSSHGATKYTSLSVLSNKLLFNPLQCLPIPSALLSLPISVGNSSCMTAATTGTHVHPPLYLRLSLAL